MFGRKVNGVLARVVDTRFAWWKPPPRLSILDAISANSELASRGCLCVWLCVCVYERYTHTHTHITSNTHMRNHLLIYARCVCVFSMAARPDRVLRERSWREGRWCFDPFPARVE